MGIHIVPEKDESGNVVTKVDLTDSQKTPDKKIQKVSIYKAEGSSGTKVTHDFTDPCTWYSKAQKVEGKVLTLDGANYSFGDTRIIDATHGRIYGEDSLTQTEMNYKVELGQMMPDSRIYPAKVYDDGVLLVEDENYQINYLTGTLTLLGGYTVNGQLTADYYKATTNDFVLKPKSGKMMIIEHAELQLSTDCDMSYPISFEVWVYHPDQASYPGLKIPYQIITYKNMKDLLNACNRGTGVFPAMGGLNNDVVVLPFDYATVKPFRDSLGAELRIVPKDPTTPISGEWGTAAFYILSQDE